MKIEKAIEKFQEMGFEGVEDFKSMITYMELLKGDLEWEVAIKGIDKVDSVTITRYLGEIETKWTKNNVKQAVELLSEKI